MKLVFVLVLAMSSCSKEHADLRTRPLAEAPRSEDAAIGPRVILPGAESATVRVELARTDGERRRGLMYRQHLAPDAGMLFVFEKEAVQSFWMKNTLLTLDMIFIRDDMTVVGIIENAAPMTTESRSVGTPSRYVLEVNGGFARAHGVTVGGRVTFDGVP